MSTSGVSLAMLWHATDYASAATARSACPVENRALCGLVTGRDLKLSDYAALPRGDDALVNIDTQYLSVWPQIAKLPTEELMRLWKDYVSAMADCLLKANDDPATEAGKRLVRDQASAHAASLCRPRPWSSPEPKGQP